MNVRQAISDLQEIRDIPRLEIDLGRVAAEANDPFFMQAVEDFYRMAVRRHPKFPLIRYLQYGVAVLELPETHDAYLKGLEASARRNIKKAVRNGYVFERIYYNDWLADIGEIHRSAPVRQGPMDADFMERDPKPVNQPGRGSSTHDYPYFGVIKDGKLAAYAGCLVAGEMILLATVFGHDAHKSDGVVPLLISGVADYALTHYPSVQYYVYDKYYGGGESLRRFKRKFRFEPYVVRWRF